MRVFTTISAMTLCLAPAFAEAATPAPCLTTGEFASLASYALPSVITGATQRCAASPVPGSWLGNNGTALAGRYSARKAGAWPAAKAAFLKISSGMDKSEGAQLLRSMPDESLQPILDNLISGMVAQRLPVERCPAVDQLIRLLAPLPPENTSELIALAVGLGAKTGGTKVGTFAICPV